MNLITAYKFEWQARNELVTQTCTKSRVYVPLEVNNMNISRDILCKIFTDNFSIEELLPLSTVCKEWRNVIFSEKVGKIFSQREGISLIPGEFWIQTMLRPIIIIALDNNSTMYTSEMEPYRCEAANKKAKEIFNSYPMAAKVGNVFFALFGKIVHQSCVDSTEKIDAINLSNDLQMKVGYCTNWKKIFEFYCGHRSKTLRKTILYILSDFEGLVTTLSVKLKELSAISSRGALDIHCCQIGKPKYTPNWEEIVKPSKKSKVNADDAIKSKVTVVYESVPYLFINRSPTREIIEYSDE